MEYWHGEAHDGVYEGRHVLCFRLYKTDNFVAHVQLPYSGWLGFTMDGLGFGCVWSWLSFSAGVAVQR